MCAYQKGVDQILRRPGQSSSEKCRLCGSEMTLERNSKVFTSYACAMANKSSTMDAFYCPNTEKKWHDKAMNLKNEIEDTESVFLKAIMKAELFVILKTGGIKC